MSSANSAAFPTPNPASPAWNIYLDNQPFNLTNLYGNETTLSLAIIDLFTKNILVQTGVYGSCFGATAVLMIVLLVLCDRKKIRKPLFLVNFSGLLVQCSRNLISLSLNCNTLTYGIGQVWLNAEAQYPQAEGTFRQVIFVILGPIFYALLLVSLIFQIRAVFPPQFSFQRILTIVLSVIAFALVGCEVAEQGIFLDFVFQNQQNLFYRVTPGLNDTIQVGLAVYVGVTCLLLVLKLFLAIRRRYLLGMRQMGPFHVFIIVFGQCLIIPCTLIIRFI